jgi:hypothetical protein
VIETDVFLPTRLTCDVAGSQHSQVCFFKKLLRRTMLEAGSLHKFGKGVKIFKKKTFLYFFSQQWKFLWRNEKSEELQGTEVLAHELPYWLMNWLLVALADLRCRFSSRSNQ